MKVGDLVWVVQTLGCHKPKNLFRDRGHGIVLGLTTPDVLDFGEKIGKVQLGDEVTVGLTTGEVEIFATESVVVVQNY